MEVLLSTEPALEASPLEDVDSISELHIFKQEEGDALFENLQCSDPAVRESAENQWASGFKTPGFLLCVVDYICMGYLETWPTTNSESFPFPLRPEKPPSTANEFERLHRRELAAVLLKQAFLTNWSGLSRIEKELIKEKLLQHMVCLPKTVRQNIHVAIAVISVHEHQTRRWPEFLPSLTFCLNACYEQHIYSGISAALNLLLTLVTVDTEGPYFPQGENFEGPNVAVRCLSEAMFNAENGVQDSLLHMAGGMKQFNFARQSEMATMPNKCRIICFRIYKETLERLGPLMNKDRDSSPELSKQIARSIPVWFKLFNKVLIECLAAPTDLESARTGISILACAEIIFSKVPHSEILFAAEELREAVGDMVLSCLSILTKYFPVFETMVINEVDCEGEISETDEGGPQTFVIAVAHLLKQLLLDPNLINFISPLFSEVVCILAPYGRVPESAVSAWLACPMSYIDGEEENCGEDISIRGALESLVIAAVEKLGHSAVCESLAKLFNDSVESSKNQKLASSPFWWKPLELALWLVGVCAFNDEIRMCLLSGQLIVAFATLGSALAQPSTPDFLKARALWTSIALRKFVAAQHPADMETILKLSVNALRPVSNFPLRITACKAICAFLETCSDDNVKSDVVNNSPELFADLGQLCGARIERSLQVVLHVLCVCLPHCSTSLPKIEGLAIPLCEQWVRSLSDPQTVSMFNAFLNRICERCPHLRDTFQDKLIPAIWELFQLKPPWQHPHQCVVCLEVVALLLKSQPRLLPSSQLWVLQPQVLALLPQSDDPALIRACGDVIMWYFVKDQNQHLCSADIAKQIASHLTDLIRSTQVDCSVIADLCPLASLCIRYLGPSPGATCLVEHFFIACSACEGDELKARFLITICELVVLNHLAAFQFLKSLSIQEAGVSSTGFEFLATTLCRLNGRSDFLTSLSPRSRLVVCLSSWYLFQQSVRQVDDHQTTLLSSALLLVFLKGAAIETRLSRCFSASVPNADDPCDQNFEFRGKLIDLKDSSSSLDLSRCHSLNINREIQRSNLIGWPENEPVWLMTQSDMSVPGSLRLILESSTAVKLITECLLSDEHLNLLVNELNVKL